MAREALVARFMSICCTSTGEARTVSELAVIVSLISIVVGMEARKKLDGLFHEGGEGQGGSLIIGLSAEGEDLLHKVSRPHGRFEDILKVPLHQRTVRDIIHGHLGETQDSGQHIVEVMGDAPGEGAYGLHLLGLAELFFGLFRSSISC